MSKYLSEADHLKTFVTGGIILQLKSCPRVLTKMYYGHAKISIFQCTITWKWMNIILFGYLFTSLSYSNLVWYGVSIRRLGFRQNHRRDLL